MQAERRSIWIIISLLAVTGLWQLSRDIQLPTGNGELTAYANAPWLYYGRQLIHAPGLCAFVSAVVYAVLHYHGRFLTLWLMALQMLVLLLVSFYPVTTGFFVLIAWMMLLSIVRRSVKKKKRQPQDDLLDDL